MLLLTVEPRSAAQTEGLDKSLICANASQNVAPAVHEVHEALNYHGIHGVSVCVVCVYV